MENLDIYVHIGMHKAASTYIQNTLFDPLAKEKEILYTDPYMTLGDLGVNEEPIISELNNKVRRVPYFSLGNSYKENLAKKLQGLLQKHQIKSNKIVLSNEYLVGAEEHNFFMDVNSLLTIKTIFDKPKILLIIRKQDDFLESWYANQIRAGRWEPLNQVLNYRDGELGDWNPSYRLNIDVKEVSYFKFINHLDTLFGKENVTVIPFERLKENGEEFVKSIVNFLGVDLDIQYNPEPVNIKYPFVTLYLTRFLNRFINNGKNPLPLLPQQPLNIFFRKYAMRPLHMRPKWIRKLMYWNANLTYVNLLYPIGKLIPIKRKFLSGDLRKKIMDVHKEDNKKLDEMRGLDLERYKYY